MTELIDRAKRLLDRIPLRYGQRLGIVFQALDSGDRGFFEIEEFCRGFCLCSRIGLPVDNLSAAYALFYELDINASGRLDFNEFINCFSKKVLNTILSEKSSQMFFSAWTHAPHSVETTARSGRDLKRMLSANTSTALSAFIPALEAVLAPRRIFRSLKNFQREVNTAIAFELADAIKSKYHTNWHSYSDNFDMLHRCNTEHLDICTVNPCEQQECTFMPQLEHLYSAVVASLGISSVYCLVPFQCGYVAASDNANLLNKCLSQIPRELSPTPLKTLSLAIDAAIQPFDTSLSYNIPLHHGESCIIRNSTVSLRNEIDIQQTLRVARLSARSRTVPSLLN